MPGKMEARQAIVDFALTLVGSHYLWGSTGATPIVGGGAFYRNPGEDDLLSVPVTIAPPLLHRRSPCVGAALCTAAGYYVCAGRFRKINGSMISDFNDPALLSFLSDCRPTDSRRVRHTRILKQVTYVSRSPEVGWQSLFMRRLTPRVILGSGVQDIPSGEIITGRAVWGEDCTNVRHFDCLGFIHYVLNHITKKYFNSPNLWAGAISDYVRNTEEVDKSDPPVAGDLVFRGAPSKKDPKEMSWEHIGFLAANGKVIQAEMAVTGVHADELYNEANWTARRRLRDGFLP
jgi:hypothetical protein